MDQKPEIKDEALSAEFDRITEDLNHVRELQEILKEGLTALMGAKMKSKQGTFVRDLSWPAVYDAVDRLRSNAIVFCSERLQQIHREDQGKAASVETANP